MFIPGLEIKEPFYIDQACISYYQLLVYPNRKGFRIFDNLSNYSLETRIFDNLSNYSLETVPFMR